MQKKNQGLEKILQVLEKISQVLEKTSRYKMILPVMWRLCPLRAVRMMVTIVTRRWVIPGHLLTIPLQGLIFC